jgi:hypothetical protein
LPNTSEKSFPSSRRTPHRAGPTSQTPYQILVLTTVNKPLFLAPLPGNKQSRSNLVSLIFHFFIFFCIS